MIATRADEAMVCSCGMRITNAITNVIAAAIAASGIHTLTALEDLSSDGSIPGGPLLVIVLKNYHNYKYFIVVRLILSVRKSLF
jgi:hypothetical protein